MTSRVDFFFYGTLRDRDVREIVMGADATGEPVDGLLPGYRCAPVEGGRFPGVRTDAGHAAPGVVVPGVTLETAARLSYFEGEGYNYGIEQCAIDVGDGVRTAWVFLPSAALETEPGVWDIDLWEASHKAGFLEYARQAMAGFSDQHRARHIARWRDRLNEPAD